MEVLKKVKLFDFLMEEQGLDTLLLEKASNLSGGQCQRLALARALLHDTPIYIFDEATSNIDVESEEAIMEQIYSLAKGKTVILISHRLANTDLILRAGMGYILVVPFGTTGIWMSWPIGWTIGTIMSLAFYAKGVWKVK